MYICICFNICIYTHMYIILVSLYILHMCTYIYSIKISDMLQGQFCKSGYEAHIFCCSTLDSYLFCSI